MARLTERQLEVATLVAAGLSNKAIARALGISPHTARNHVVRVAARIPGDGPPRLKIMRWWYCSRQPTPAD